MRVSGIAAQARSPTRSSDIGTAPRPRTMTCNHWDLSCYHGFWGLKKENSCEKFLKKNLRVPNMLETSQKIPILVGFLVWRSKKTRSEKQIQTYLFWRVQSLILRESGGRKNSTWKWDRSTPIFWKWHVAHLQIHWFSWKATVDGSFEIPDQLTSWGRLVVEIPLFTRFDRFQVVGNGISEPWRQYVRNFW